MGGAATAWAAPPCVVERLRDPWDNWRGRDETAREIVGAALYDLAARGWVVLPAEPAELWERLALPPKASLPCLVIAYAYVPPSLFGKRRDSRLLFSRRLLRYCGNSTALALGFAYLLGELRASATGSALVCYPGGRLAVLDVASLTRVSA